MQRLIEILFTIGISLVILVGIFGVVYDVLIWDKSIIPNWIFVTAMIVGGVGILLTLPFVIYKSKRGEMD